LFQKVFEILPIGLWIADKAGKLLSSNEAGRKIWGAEPLVSQEEYHVFKAKRLPSREDVAPEDWALGHTVHKGVTIKDEMLEIEAFDGEKKIILNYTAPVLNEDGQIQAAIVINQDITEQFRNDMIQKLQSNIARAVISIKDLSELFSVIRSELAVLFDTTNFVYATYDKNTDMLFAPFEVDEKGDITSSWKAEKSLTGYMLAKRAPLLLSQEQMNALYASGEVNLVGVPSLSWMGVPLFKGDTISGAILVQSYNNPNAYEAKSLEVLEIIAHEMSIYIEKKESEEEALKLSRAIIQSPVSVVITDLAGSIVFANPKFCTVTGYTNAEAIGSNPRILKSGNHNDEFYRNMWQTLLSGCDWQGEMLNKKKDGSLYWESVIISPILNDRGDIIYYVGIKEDITEKKMMLEELIKAKDKAEESDRLKTGFLQNMSHEIRTPMHGILGFTSLLEQDNIGPKEVKEFASYIRTSGNRMMELINNILDISKIESGEVEVIENKVELIKVMQDLQNLFKPLCDAKGLALSYQLSDELKSAKVITDELKVIQIMSNLISNAVKFTDAGDITFSANLKDNHLEFKVVDTGCGVPEKHRAHIFDRFYQADMSMARGYEGAGLGLSICLGLVNLLGGQISFETVEDLGSTFIVNLPVQVEHSALPKVLNTPPDPKINGYIVLVAEDDDINYYYLSRVLKTHNFRVLRALNGQEAIDLVSSKPEIDLILMDIKMPVMNGLQATKIIREQHPNLPIIAQTAYAFDNEKANAMEAGCTEYLTKPINSSELFSCIEKVMRIKQ
jgi:PAS domain S-box-containing protein